jgi:hypothetical protein
MIGALLGQLLLSCFQFGQSFFLDFLFRSQRSPVNLNSPALIVDNLTFSLVSLWRQLIAVMDLPVFIDLFVHALTECATGG